MDDQNKSLNERWAPGRSPRERGYASDPGYVSGETPATSREYDAPPSADEETTARTRQIRSEIDRTREDMGETLDAIQDRLNPRNAASRAAGNVRDAAVGRMRQVAHTIQDRMPGSRRQAYDSRHGYGFFDRVRENPVPAVLAATGLAWLAFAGRREDQQYRRAIYGSTRGGRAFVQEGRIDVSTEESYGSDVAGYRGGDMDEGSGSTMRRASEALSSTGERLRRRSTDVGYRARRFAEYSPIAAAGVAAAVGLAIGMMIPETERENELMGETRDSLLEKGKDTVRQTAQRVQDTAKDVQRAAGEAVRAVTETDVRGADNP